MKSAADLLKEYTENFQNPNYIVSLFSEAGTIELPYFSSLNLPSKIQGKENIIKFIGDLLKTAPDYKFINFKQLIDTHEQAFAEYEVDMVINTRHYKQLFMTRLVAENGKIKLIRIACDSLQIAKLCFSDK